MSGRKTTMVSISDDELRNLRMRAARATSLQESNNLLNQLSVKNDAALAEYRNRINSLNGNIDSLNRKLEEQRSAANKETMALRTQLQQTIRESNVRLQELSRQNEARVQELHTNFSNALTRTRSELADALDQTREDVANAISTNNRRIEAAMRKNNQQLNSEMRALEERMHTELQDVHSKLDGIDASIQSISQNNNTLLQMAQEYAETTQTLLDEIRNNYRVEILCPGRLQPVVNSFESANREITESSRLPENSATARHAARVALEDAFRLYQDVVIAEQEWQLRYEETRQIINTTMTQLEASRRIEIPDEDNIVVDVDQWADGDLTSIENRVETLENQINNPDMLNIETLGEMRVASLQISREIDDTSVFAVEAFYASQDRADIAEDIAEQLYDYGLSVAEVSYCGNDKRSAHRIRLRSDRTGLEIVITQTPVLQPDGSIANNIESDILNYGTQDAEEAGRIVRDVINSLNNLGIQLGEIKTTPGFENNTSDRVEVADVQQWRNEKKPEVIRPIHS